MPRGFDNAKVRLRTVVEFLAALRNNLLLHCYNKKKWAFYHSSQFLGIMIKQYIDNLNHIFPELNNFKCNSLKLFSTEICEFF